VVKLVDGKKESTLGYMKLITGVSVLEFNSLYFIGVTVQMNMTMNIGKLLTFKVGMLKLYSYIYL